MRVVGIGQDLLDYDEPRELEKVGRELARGDGAMPSIMRGGRSRRPPSVTTAFAVPSSLAPGGAFDLRRAA